MEYVERVKKQDKLMRTSDYYEKEVFPGCVLPQPGDGPQDAVYAANFVLADYGTGCVMAVPPTTSATSSLPRSTICP